MFGSSRSYSLSCVHTLPAHQTLIASDSIRLAQVVNDYPVDNTPQLKLVPSREDVKKDSKK